MEELAKHLGITTVYATATYAFFHWLDENASDEAKAVLARTMSFKDYKNEQVASALAEVFDRIYTYPLLGWRAFGRSFLITIVVSAIYVFEVHYFYGIYLILLLFFNIFTDYLSLFVIRPLLIRSGTKPVIGLSVGAVSGATIVWAANALRIFVLFTIWDFFQPGRPMPFPPMSVWAALRDATPWGLEGWTPMAYVWPAAIVFAWLPLFALGIVAARVLTPMTWVVGRTQWFLKEGKEHPLKAIGYVAAVVVFLGTVVGRAVFSA